MMAVYLEKLQGSVYAEQIATFESEEVYMLCVPALEAWAEAQGLVITESMDEEEDV